MPEGFIAESTIYTGSIEVDVQVDEWTDQATSLGVMYQVPVPSTVIRTDNFEASEVQVFDLHHARKTVGVIEIVSPANKDRPQHREAFLAKCYSFIAYGVSTVIIDIVTSRTFNFHEALIQKLQVPAEQIKKDNEAKLYCSSYRYKADKAQPVVEVWHIPLQVGNVLPDLPIFISPQIAIPIRLENAYQRTCQELKIDN